MWKRVRQLHLEVIAFYFAYRDSRVPIYAKVLSACVIGYAFSPIDFIPDFIPFAGQLDDVVVVPLGFLAVRRMIPAPILTECQIRAQLITRRYKRWGWIAAGGLASVIAGVIVAALFSTAAATIWVLRAAVR